MNLIIPEGDIKNPEGPPRGVVPKDFFGTRRVIQDRIQSLTHDNDILSCLKSRELALDSSEAADNEFHP